MRADTAAFLAVNRNKRSVALDLKDDAHRAAFLRLADDADVVLENNRPGVAERLGVDYETLSARSTRGWSTRRSPASGRPARTRSARATT